MQVRPRLVFVHGIGGVRRQDEELAIWSEALARGAVAAGHSLMAAALNRADIDVALAYYGDLFQPDGAQGDSGELTEADAQLVIGLLDELIEQQLTVAADERSMLLLAEACAQLRPAGVPQGAGNLARHAGNAVTTLLEWWPLRQAGQWSSSRVLITQLGQVARYLNRNESDGRLTLDQRIRDRVRECLGSGPVTIVAHSLGTVVTFEVLHEFTGAVPLLVTLGSPIGMRTVVWPRLRPQPPSTPEPVRRWLNFWDRDDVVAVRPRAESGMRPNSNGVLPHSARTDSDGIWVHPAVKYLAQPAVAGPVMEIMAAQWNAA